MWATVAAFVGFVPFLFVFVLPLLVGNTIVMAFILTNHSLSPRVAINDPLVERAQRHDAALDRVGHAAASGSTSSTTCSRR